MGLRFTILVAVFSVAFAAGADKAAAAPVTRQTTTVALAAHSAAGRVQCDRLAAAISPEANMAGQVDQLLTAMLNSLVGDMEGFGALEKRYPGMMDTVALRVRPVMLRNAQETLPPYRADIAKFYCDNLTVKEALVAADFFSSPEGVAMLTVVSDSIDYKRSAAAIAQERDVSMQDLEADKRRAGLRVMKALSPAQIAKIDAFSRSPVGRRLVSLMPQRNVIERKWFNYSRPEQEKAVELATVEAILEHVAKTDPETAAAMRAGFEADGTIPKKP